MTVIGKRNSKKMLAGSVYLVVVLIIATAWSLRGPALMAANETASAVTVESSEHTGKEAPASGEHGSNTGDGQIDPAGLLEPALQVIRSTARKVIF